MMFVQLQIGKLDLVVAQDSPQVCDSSWNSNEVALFPVYYIGSEQGCFPFCFLSHCYLTGPCKLYNARDNVSVYMYIRACQL